MLAFTHDALVACGVPEADAAVAAKQMIEADITGFDAHGIFRLGMLLQHAEVRPLQSQGRTSARCSARPRPRWSMATTASAIW